MIDWITKRFDPITPGTLWARYEGDDGETPFDPEPAEPRTRLVLPVVGWLTGYDPETDLTDTNQVVAAVVDDRGLVVPAPLLQVRNPNPTPHSRVYVRARLHEVTTQGPAELAPAGFLGGDA